MQRSRLSGAIRPLRSHKAGENEEGQQKRLAKKARWAAARAQNQTMAALKKGAQNKPTRAAEKIVL